MSRLYVQIPNTLDTGTSAKLRLFVSRAPVDPTHLRLLPKPRGARQPVQQKSITFSEVPQKIKAAIKLWGFKTKAEFLRSAAQRYIWDIEQSLKDENNRRPRTLVDLRSKN